jgi:hypothetical protein
MHGPAARVTIDVPALWGLTKMRTLQHLADAVLDLKTIVALAQQGVEP